MAKAIILKPDGGDIDSINTLAEELDLECVVCDYPLTLEECRLVLEDCDATIIVVDNNIPLNLLEQLLKTASARNCRIIGVWSRSGGVTDLPPSIESYATDVLTWDAVKINGAASGTSEPKFEDPHGEEREEPATERNKC